MGTNTENSFVGIQATRSTAPSSSGQCQINKSNYGVCDTCVPIRRGARQVRQARRIKRGAKLDKVKRVGDHEG